MLGAAVLHVVQSVLDRRRRRQQDDAPTARTIGVLLGVGSTLPVTGVVILT